MVKLPHQMDRCEVCGHKTLKIDLVRTNVDFLAVEGQNHTTHSSFHTDAWSLVNGVDAGLISIGPYADRARVVIGDDNSTSEPYGSQTWTVSDPISVYQGIVRIAGAPLDVSTWESIVVSFDYGFYQQEQNQDATAYVYIYDWAGNNGNITRKYTRGIGGGRYWDHIPVSDIDGAVDLTDLKVYIVIGTYSGGEQVWIDRIQIEKDAERPGAFAPTSGAVVNRIDTPMMTVRKVCQGCFEKPRVRSEQYNREAEQRTEDPVAVEIQEV